MRKYWTAAIAGLIALVIWEQGGAANAQTLCAPPGISTDIRPGASGAPTEVMVGLRLADLLNIDDVNQTITLDLAIRMQWTDDRLAKWAGCKLPINAIWFPRLDLENSGRVFLRWPQTASIDEGGKVTYLQRISGTLASYHQLFDFPFDRQKIILEFLTLDWSAEKVSLRVDEAFTGMRDQLNISDWQISGVDVRAGQRMIDALQKDRSLIELEISAQRYLGFYIWKVLMPIALIVVMSWSVFWIDPVEFGAQVGLSATSVLTMIAFIFASSNMLPRLAHFTLLDRYVAWSTVFVFLALLQSLSTGVLAAQNRVELARRIDVASRIAFPLAFFLLCIVFYQSRS